MSRRSGETLDAVEASGNVHRRPISNFADLKE
jgi:hypothetical protein